MKLMIGPTVLFALCCASPAMANDPRPAPPATAEFSWGAIAIVRSPVAPPAPSPVSLPSFALLPTTDAASPQDASASKGFGWRIMGVIGGAEVIAAPSLLLGAVATPYTRGQSNGARGPAVVAAGLIGGVLGGVGGYFLGDFADEGSTVGKIGTVSALVVGSLGLAVMALVVGSAGVAGG